MKTSTLAFIFVSLFALSCEDNSNPGPNNQDNDRYKRQVYPRIEISRDIIYGNNISQGGNHTELRLDFYEPLSDTARFRPLLVLAHGGGFVSGEKEELVELATFLASSGYAVASIQYRLIDVPLTETSLKQGILEAVFDMKAAIRFFRKDAQSTNLYKIDLSNIFIGGYSAGAFLSLHYAYMNTEAEINQAGGTALVNYLNARGGIEGDSGHPGFSSEVKGVINLAGALIAADFVDRGEPRLFSIHGVEDTVVPFLEGESDGSGLITQGSGLIHPRAQQLGLINQLKAREGVGHDVLDACGDCLTDLRSFLYENLN